MPIEHLLDQHCAPNAVYFLDAATAERLAATAETTKKVFGPIFGKWFRKLTGVNPRSRAFKPDSEIVQHLRAAQRKYMQFLMAETVTELLPSYTVVSNQPALTIEKELDCGWLAAMLGSFVVNKDLIVSLKAQEPSVLTVRKRPPVRATSRSLHETQEVPEDKKHAAISKVARKLARGVQLPTPHNNDCLPLPELLGVRHGVRYGGPRPAFAHRCCSFSFLFCFCVLCLKQAIVRRVEYTVKSESCSNVKEEERKDEKETDDETETDDEDAMDDDDDKKKKKRKTKRRPETVEYKYLISMPSSSKAVYWEELRHVRASFPILEDPSKIKMETDSQIVKMEMKDGTNFSIQQFIIVSGSTEMHGDAAGVGVRVNAEHKLKEMMRSASTATLNSIVILLKGHNQVIAMPNVGRDGGALDDGSLGVSPGDVGAFQFMLRVAELVPAALRPVLADPTRLAVLHGPLLWWIRDTWLLPDKLRRLSASPLIDFFF